MNNGMFKKLLPHGIAVLIFLIVALIYCRPVLQDKVLQQNDVTQWKAMAQNSFEYKEKHGRFPLWTNSMFSGMPAYQIAIEPEVVVSPGFLYGVFTLYLPKPMNFFFLACICFYFLTQVLRVNPFIGIIGGLAYAYATYNPVIIAAGHDTKMQSIALMPAVIASLLLVFEKRYWIGGALTALFSALIIAMNHPQIVYYTFLIALFMTGAYVIRWVRQKQFRHLLLSGAIVIAAALAGVLTNAVVLATTYEYARASIRGGSELADANSSSTKDGLSTDYALSYSFYKSEPFVLLVPDLYGGSSAVIEERVEESKAMETLQAMPPELANQLAGFRTAYWGGIVEGAGTSGPPYSGAIICFLTLIGFFLLDNKHKWWILAAGVLAILMSWGHYLKGFNEFLLNTLPMYNKFRAPSMIMVIPTFLFCMMAVLTLDRIITPDKKTDLWQPYKKGLLLTGGVFAVLLLFYMSADFTSESDRQLLQQAAAAPEQVKDYIRNFLNALQDDRQSLMFGSLLRSFLFIAAAALVIWFALRGKLKNAALLGVVGLLSFIDIMSVDSRYLNADNYQDAAEYENNFVPTAADSQILQDTSYYRVFDLRQGLGTLTYGAGTAYFHNSIGGYHPAKLSIYQDLIEKQLTRFPESMPVVNMLNTKYIIQADQQGKESVYNNPDALGHAWFVKGVRFENSPAAVMNALSHFNPKDTAIVLAADRTAVGNATQTDSAATITLVHNDNDVATYTANTAAGGFAVFSEVYYRQGWKAYIDNRETPIIRTNYVLRGLNIPAGQHQIRFEFRPASYYQGETLALIAGILILLALLVAIFQLFRKKGVTGSTTPAQR